MTWHRYVAIGDSFTEGVGDPDPARPESYIGWADRLAGQLAKQNSDRRTDFDYANLAIRGRLLADVVGPQLDAALPLEPDLLSMIGGGNDILRPRADLDDIADRIEAAAMRARTAGADVLLATLADPAQAPVIKAARPRIAAHNANLWGIAQRTEAYVLDIWSMRSLRDARMWSPDRLHLSTEGHRRVALQAGWTLGAIEGEREWAAALPAGPVLSRAHIAHENAAWAKDYLAPWVQRRLKGRSSGDDLLPKQPEPRRLTSRND
ncbi:SGNH/GDSL hydrolase family protein [Allobranchiibius sp. GilTou38]|uniref:SGNH/GDSL hydrolase family protein n=1 Tax=Allobranchiibius sp. GilTou38 TaxID=2815210 RepID=UPI001AA1087A|nr:SGNH/GDSL hydrolase family protein [Allobranchiibius sp. GilTou38]MBO1765979.1 SGNH/GDSL hydrolase family protein [Allobranchiibius sp. GilTou38]